MCHGEDLKGHPPTFPSLVGVGERLTSEQITAQIRNGKGAMPAFAKLTDDQVAALLRYIGATHAAPAPPVTAPASDMAKQSTTASPLAHAGGETFQQNCAFCHGRDAGGGETGPDLTRSKLVAADVNGDKIGDVVRNGRPDKGMPSFHLSDQELAGVVAFIHAQALAASQQKPGSRKGVDVSDLQTGNVDAGKAYFNGAGGCSKCHSPTGDLAGIASRYQGLQLEERMLYPRNAKSKVTVTLPSGEKITGTLAFLDEFTVGLRDEDGRYRSWTLPSVKYTVDDPAEAHVDQFPKYTDDDVHNLMAYLQTLR
jgi:mono/diheme cytochrome c family protein